MKLLVVLLAVVAGALAANIKGNSFNGLRVFRHPNIGTRIVGGEAGNINQLSYMLSARDPEFGHICGACIVSATRALTAAHCTEWHRDFPLTVQAGSNSIRSGGQIVPVGDAINHEQFNSNTFENDISVLTLRQPLNIGQPGISPITLPQHGAEIDDGTLARVSGWGSAYEGQQAETFLRTTEVPIVSNHNCSIVYGGGITEGMICAGHPQGGRDACQSDSGGPLTIGREIIGIVSWGYGCARPNTPRVYTRVAYYRNWVDRHV